MPPPSLSWLAALSIGWLLLSCLCNACSLFKGKTTKYASTGFIFLALLSHGVLCGAHYLMASPPLSIHLSPRATSLFSLHMPKVAWCSAHCS